MSLDEDPVVRVRPVLIDRKAGALLILPITSQTTVRSLVSACARQCQLSGDEDGIEVSIGNTPANIDKAKNFVEEFEGSLDDPPPPAVIIERSAVDKTTVAFDC